MLSGKKLGLGLVVVGMLAGGSIAAYDSHQQEIAADKQEQKVKAAKIEKEKQEKLEKEKQEKLAAEKLEKEKATLAKVEAENKAKEEAIKKEKEAADAAAAEQARLVAEQEAAIRAEQEQLLANQQAEQAEQAVAQQEVASVHQEAAPVGSSAKEWIAQKESSGSYDATNGRYIGRYQLDASYLNGDHSQENQERVADAYVAGRYGSWEAAQAFWVANGWY